MYFSKSHVRERRVNSTLVLLLAQNVLFSLILLFVLLHSSTQLQAQSPGSYNTDLAHWYRATDCLCPIPVLPPCASGSDVGSINPTAAAGGLATSSATGVKYFPGLSNFNPAMTLSSGYFSFAKVGPLNGDMSAFVVMKSASNIAAAGSSSWLTDAMILGGDNSGDQLDFGLTWDDGKIRFAHQFGNENYNYSSDVLNFKNGPMFLTTAVRNRDNMTADTVSMFFNGFWFAGTGTRRTGNSLISTPTLYVGQNQPFAGAFFNGNVAEVILYRNILTNLQRERIESYLGLKHGLTLTHPYRALDGTGGRIYTSLGGFDKGIVGVGLATGSLFDQRISASVDDPGFVIINANPAPLTPPFPTVNAAPCTPAPTDNTYLTIGNDGGAKTFTKQFVGGTTKLAATYKVVDVGYGQVTLLFKQSTFTDLNATNSYYLVYGKDPGLGIGETYVSLANITASNDFTVNIDFPADTTYFTLTTVNAFSGPANVIPGMELWLRSEKGFTNPVGTTTWSDYSYSDHNLTRATAVSLGKETGGPLVNYHNYVHSIAMARDFRTTKPFKARSIVAVVKTKLATANDGIMGFDNLSGLRMLDPTNLAPSGNSADWGNGATGAVYQNGITTAPFPMNEWSIITAVKGNTQMTNRLDFFLGEYQSAGSLDSLKFAEVLVYDQDLSLLSSRQRLESYLAIKYGITLKTNYFASDGVTVVYNRTGYPNDIFGIARDNPGLLLQRQSRAQTPTSVVGMGLVVIDPLNDSLNTGTIALDQHFMIMGHNGAAPSLAENCWTTLDMNVVGELGRHVRIQREWKIDVTGSSWSGNIQFTLQTNNTAFPLPALPTGSPTYNLYLSTSNSFNTIPATNVYPMTLVSAGKYRVDVPATLFNTGGAASFYMTFGTKIGTSFASQTICPGGTAKVFHSMVGTGDRCSQLTLTNTSPPLNTFVANSLTATNISANGGCIDTLYYALPLTINPGVYTVRFDTALTSAPCGSAVYPVTAVPGNAPVALTSFTVVEPDTGNLVYPVGPFCLGVGNIVPTTFGPDLGVFSILSGPGGVPISSVVPSNSSGVIAIHSGLIPVGTTSTFNLQFVTNGPACRDTATYSFTVNTNGTSSISYPGTPFCGGLTVPVNPTIMSLPVGTIYSSQPPLPVAALNPSNGVLTVSQVPNPGNYVITASPLAGQCISPSSTTISVTSALQATFEYLDTTLCVGSGSTAPFITSRPSTGSFVVPVASPSAAAGLFMTPSTGVIDLNFSLPGDYYVDYVVGGVSACTLNTRDVIHVYAKPDASFTITDTILCANGPGTLCMPTTGGGTFSVLTPHLTVSGSTVSPTGNVGGPFWVGYRLNTMYCTDSTSENVQVNGLQVPTVSYGDTTFCKNESDPHVAFLSGTAGGDFIGSPGLVIDTTGTIDLAATPAANNYTVSYVSPDLACPNTSVVATIDVRAVPNAAFTLTPTSVCAESGLLSFPLPGGMPANQFSMWSGSQEILGAFNALDSIDVDTIPPGGPYEISNIRYDGYCADTAYDYLVVNRRDSANIVFNPNKVCVGDFDPYPVNLGDGGGTFLAVGANAIGAGVDLLTGTVDLDSNSAQVWYTVQYTTAGVCPSTDIDSVELALKVPAFFRYRFLNYCLSYPGIVAPDSIASPGDGLFSAGVGLVIDSTTGVVNLDSSVAGTYNVRYKIKLNGACADDYVVTLTLVAEVTGATLTVVPNDSFCWRGSENVAVQVANAGNSGGVFSSDVGLVFSNFELGEVSLSGSYPQRDSTYTIFYTLSTVCEEVFTTEISIAPRDTARFDYADNAYCNQSPDELPSFATPSGGIFTIYSDSSNALANSTIDPQTGLLPLLFNSGEGTVGIQYLTVGACPDSTITYVRISDPPTDYEMLVNTGNVICQGTPVLVTGTGATFNFYYLNGDSVDSGNETTFLNLQDNDTVTVEFITDLGCKVYLDTVFEVQPIPYDRIVSYPDIISGGDPFEINVQATTSDGTYFEWFILDYQGALEFPSFSGYSLDTIDSGAVSVIPIALTMTEDFSPAQFTFMVQPRTELCRGPLDTILVKVNPNQQDIFVPQVMTPDGNGQNDTWLIQWKDVVNPSDFTMLLYNEAGAKVLTMSPLKSDWGGDNLPDGVYWYLMLDAKGELVESGSGGLTIRRK
jgi:hypothetical protein